MSSIGAVQGGGPAGPRFPGACCRRCRMRPRWSLLIRVSLVLVAAIPAGAAQTVPPQFITPPILLHVGEPGLDHGHFVFGGEAAVPAPLAPPTGAASYAAATASSFSVAA